MATIFSDDALIITGSVMKNAGAEQKQPLNKNLVRYTRQTKQDYFSSSYDDTGYLFLMVDLNNSKEPVIHVRTWQPEKDPDFGLIDLSYF